MTTVLFCSYWSSSLNDLTITSLKKNIKTGANGSAVYTEKPTYMSNQKFKI